MNHIRFPAFFAIPIFFAVAFKSVADAFFEVGYVKYLYFSLLLFGVFFHRTGQAFLSDPAIDQRASRELTVALWCHVASYFAFLLLLIVNKNGSPEMILKIISPFIFFGFLIAAADKSLPFALALGAALNIICNAALLPFDYGWTYWGNVYTFKGFYLFKTDLSYSLAMSVLIYSAWRRFKPTPDVLALAVLSVGMVFLSNSRLNYATILIVLVFIAYRNSNRPAVLAGYAAFLGCLGALVVFLFDPSKYLGFDLSSMGGFTQGRDRIFSVLFEHILTKYSPTEVIFGGGLYADLIIYMENVSDGIPHGAHNDFLYQVTTQGLFGLLLNLSGWFLIYKITTGAGPRVWAKGLILVSILVYLFQGLTLAVSVFALKTWPLAMVFLLIYVSPDSATSEQATTNG